ncbi:MAG: cytochrome c maturation protein CcmE [Chloroflexi bacterium]|nr:cytochrome c maturation protein CcmE [Chloroflexota bacterium]
MVSNVQSRSVASKPRSASLVKRKKFFIGGAIVLLAIAYLMYSSIQDATLYYLTPTELVNQTATSSATTLDRGVRLGGRAVEGSIKFDSSTRILSFKVGDDNAEIPVVYKGIIPDTFEEGVDVIVEGKYTPQGVFEASTLLAKCPSKYVPE